MSRTLHHRDIKEPRYDRCERLNPNWEDTEPELLTQGKKYPPALPGPDDDYIKILSTPPASGELSEGKTSFIPPPARRGTNYIPSLAVGVGERDRQEAIKAAQDRKISSGFTNNPALPKKIYTFIIAAAHYCYRPAG
jgi:hypothetical protein